MYFSPSSATSTSNMQSKPSSDTSDSNSDVESTSATFTNGNVAGNATEGGNECDDDFKFCTRRRCIFLTISIGGALIVALSLILTNDPNPLNYFIPVDPSGRKEATRWDATSGLYLTVENACDETWYPIVEQTIEDWNQSDAVTLQTTRIEYDYDCEPRNGRLKVCNGDYGDTDWHGINIALIDKTRNVIVHSVSKLNDRLNKNDDAKRYISCHENGHGLGLPHTDEDHFNRDRGDCMDYTIRPQNNMVPGDYNLNLLKQLYGTPTDPIDPSIFSNKDDESATNNGGSIVGTPPPPFRPNYGNDDDDDEEDEKDNKDKKDKDDRRLRHRQLRQSQRGRRHLATDEEIFQAELEIQYSCKDDYCYVQIDDVHALEVTKFVRHDSMV